MSIVGEFKKGSIDITDPLYMVLKDRDVTVEQDLAVTENLAVTGDVAVTGELTFAGDQVSRTTVETLADADTAGGVLAWVNPIAGNVLVQNIVVITTTKSTGASTVDAGVAADGTTSADNLLDGVDTGTAAGTFGTADSAGTNGLTGVVMASGEYVTISKASGACAALVGTAYITYMPL